MTEGGFELWLLSNYYVDVQVSNILIHTYTVYNIEFIFVTLGGYCISSVQATY